MQATTTIVASVMHDNIIGVDITRKLTIPHAAKLPIAAPAGLCRPADASPTDEAIDLQGASLLESEKQHKEEAELAGPFDGRQACPNAAKLSLRKRRVANQVDLTEEPAGLVDLAAQDSASADTSHHAALSHEALLDAGCENNKPDGRMPAQRSQTGHAERSAALHQHRAADLPNGVAGRHMLTAGQSQLTFKGAGRKAGQTQPQRQQSEAASFGSRQVACAGALAGDGKHNGPSSQKITARPSSQKAHPFEAFMFKPAANANATPTGAECCSF